MTLTDFLLARLAEDEWEAQRALSTLTNEINHARLLNLTSTREEILAAPHLGAPIRRMFAEVEAKRRIVEQCSADTHCSYHGGGRSNKCEGCATAEAVAMNDVCVLCYLALPYADHPDYLEEWKP